MIGCCPVAAHIPADNWLATAMTACPIGGAEVPLVPDPLSGGAGLAIWSAIWACDKPFSRAGLKPDVTAIKRPATSTKGAVPATTPPA